MTIDPFWKSYVDECRAKGFPVVVAQPEPWFSIHYLCANFLMIERVADIVTRCEVARVPMLLVNRKKLIRVSDLEKVFNCEPVTSPKGKVTA